MERIRTKNHVMSHLTGAEHFDLHENILYYLDLLLPEELVQGVALQRYRGCFGEEKRLFKKTHRTRRTPWIGKADRARNVYFIRLKRSVGYFLISEDAAERAAADVLKEIILPYKRVYRTAYMMKSAYLDRLVDALRTGEAAGAVALLGLEERVSILEEANEHFRQVFYERSARRYAPENRLMKAGRKDTDLAFREVAFLINNMYAGEVIHPSVGHPSDELRLLIDSINAYILTAETIYMRRVNSYYKSGK